MDKKKKKRKIKKNKNKQKTKSQPITPPSVETIDLHTQRLCKPKLPCRLCKGDHLMKDCHGLVLVLEEWSKVSRQPMSSASGHHTDDPPSTSDSVVKIRKGKVRNPCLIFKGMHFTYLCPLMDEASKLLEDITVSHQRLPTGYRKLSLNIPLVDKVVNLVLTLVDPTLPLKSEVEVVNSVSSIVDPMLPLKSEVKMVESMSYPPDPTLSSESVNN